MAKLDICGSNMYCCIVFYFGIPEILRSYIILLRLNIRAYIVVKDVMCNWYTKIEKNVYGQHEESGFPRISHFISLRFAN